MVRSGGRYAKHLFQVACDPFDTQREGRVPRVLDQLIDLRVFVLIEIVIVNHRMRHSKVAEEIHEAVDVVLSNAVEYVKSAIGVDDLAVANKPIDKCHFVWPSTSKT